MVSVAELREADLGPLDEVATAYDKLAAAFQGHVDQLNTQVVKHIFDNRWIGTAAGAANSSLQNTTNRLDAAHTEMSAMGSLLREAADSFRLAQSKLQEALQEAQSEGFTVAGDGSVSWPPPAAAERNDPKYDAPQKGKDIATRISDAVTEASDADARIAKLLDDLAQRARTGSGLDTAQAQKDLGTVTQAGTDLLTAGFPPKGTTPAQVRDWWNGLTPDEQQRLIKAHPDLIGNRDGIPSPARDQANQINLTNLINEYQNKPNKSAADQNKLDGFNKIKEKLAQPGQVPPLLLLGIGDEGQGRAILSYGNPDTAQNVSALVPGLGGQISDVAGKDGTHAFNIWKAAKDADPTSSTASIVWLGYDPPPGDIQPAALNAMYPDQASSGAVSYDQFLGGLRATHQGAPAHVTAIGHSYGTTVIGWAGLRPGGTGAGDIVLVGSPGVGADKASQLNIDPGHVWVGAAGTDPISKVPSASRVAGDAALSPVLGPGGADWVYNQVDPNQLYFGTDPASAQFGAQRFQVADGDVSSSHFHYMDTPPDPNQRQQDSQDSIANIGRIVAGQYNKVTRVPGR
ncbi:alpha/beta hydrolase [Kitasatospora sp. GP30]|uniref:alpha/beta hydrolase n=1 Tax=Kitasatospora sp. GP30 TaxID=3035084 RepID=UPI000C70D20D|nr:alpha/beta hydrolase [Kitasatospora sp. GP30]